MCAPLVCGIAFAMLFIAAGLSILYFTVYPDHHATENDFGTERQQAIMQRYRQFTSRVSFWRRCGRVLVFAFRRKRNRHGKSLRRTP